MIRLHTYYYVLLLITLFQLIQGSHAEPPWMTAAIKDKLVRRQQQDVPNYPTKIEPIPGRMIVEFAEPTNMHGDLDAFMTHLKSKYNDIDLSTAQLFDHPFVHAASIDIKTNSFNHDQIMNTAAKFTGVSKIYPVHAFPRPQSSFVSSHSNEEPVENAMLLSPHAQTQVDRVHRELNLTGKGIVIGIIDTGIDYTHPALGGGFGEGFKVRYGRDLVGDNFTVTPGAVTYPDDDPMESCNISTIAGHGTHVAGIIAGKAENFTGVAPDATLGMWRVFGCSAGTTSDLIVQAALEAVDVGADIISLSLGTDVAWDSTFSATVFNRIAANGTKVIIAAGNSGLDGAYTIGSPSTARDVMSIASFNNDHYLAKSFEISGSSETYAYVPAHLLQTEKMPDGQLVLGELQVGEACNESMIPENVKGNLALVQVKGCNPKDKAGNLTAAGAIGVVFYSTSYDYILPRSFYIIEGLKIPIAHVATPTGKQLVHLIDSSLEHKVNITFNNQDTVWTDQTTGNLVSYFSSIGPTYDNQFKPDIGGIGGAVYSTVPGIMGRWATMSGTSMACPYVAGATALYLEHLGDRRSEYSNIDILERYQNYAHQARLSPNDDDLDTPLHQGAGLIQLYDSIMEPVHVSPGSISFNDTAHLHKTHTLTVTNTGHDIVSYEMINSVSASVVPYNASSDYILSIPAHYMNTHPARLRFSKKTFKLGPGETTELTVSILPPKTNPDEHIMYGGYVRFKSFNNQQVKDITVPYFGIVGDQNDLPVFAKGGPYITNQNLTRLYEADTTYTIDLDDQTSLPLISLFLRMGTQYISTPLYDVTTNEHVGYAWPLLNSMAHTNLNSAGALTLPWFGTYYKTQQPMDPDFFFHVDATNMIQATKGHQYRIEFQGLKVFGDPNNKEDWETWRSCTFEIQ